MKLNKLLLGVLAAGMFGACSSDNVPDGPGNEPGKAFKGDGYLNITIQMPTTTGTRANDVFEDGAESEWTVSEACILLFKASETGNDPTYVGVSKVSDVSGVNEPNNAGITRTIMVKDITLEEGQQLYALALINYSGIATYTAASGENPATISILDAQLTEATKFSDVEKMITSKSFYTRNEGAAASHIFMTNAVLSTVPGGSADPGTGEKTIQTLANITGSLWPTEKLAQEHPAGCIYVERAVGKVTVTNSGSYTLSLKAGDSAEATEYTVEIEGYALSNVEPNSYLVRNWKVETAGTGYQTGVTGFAWNLSSTLGARDKFRMVSSQNMAATTDLMHDINFYRTYWCVDPAGDGYSNVDASTLTAKIPTASDFVKLTEPLYGYENTFSIANQNHGNTTRVVFKATLKKGEEATTFYTMDGIKDRIYAATDIQKRILSKFINDNGAALEAALKKVAKENQSFTISDNTNSDILFIWSNEDIAKLTGIKLGNYTESKLQDGKNVNDVIAEFNKADNTEETTPTKLNNAIDAANNSVDYEEYKDGVMYYTAYIQHFGDDGCPIQNVTSDKTSEVYGENYADYLGRWGFVRNNWYDLSIDQILSLGDSDVPTIDFNTADDSQTPEKYMRVAIHILSWAKRTQHNIFQ